MINRKMTLEARIARLEKLVSKSAKKFEGLGSDAMMTNTIIDFFNWGYISKPAIKALANGDGSLAFAEFMDYARSGEVYDWLIDEVNKLKVNQNDILKVLQPLAIKAVGKKKATAKLSSEDENAVEEWFDDNMGPDMYESKREWIDDLKWMSKGAPNGSQLEDCCDETGIGDADSVAIALAKFAKDALDDIKYNKAHGQDTVRLWTDPWA